MYSQPERIPWLVSTPLKPAIFHSLKKNQKCYLADLSQISPFYLKESKTIGFCDLQIPASGGSSGTYGSGRSFFYNGLYFKGAGRTQLAGNWNRLDTLYHSSGHLFASAAVREYLITQYLKKNSKKEIIVECENIFLKPALKKMIDAHKTGNKLLLNKIDLKFQAITTKKGDFYRYSNFVWLLSFMRQKNHFLSFSNFIYLLQVALLGSNSRIQLTARDLVLELEKSIFVGLENFSEFYRCGVEWNSITNNITADFRFLDLELPLITGRGFFGVKSAKEISSTDSISISQLFGMEYFHAISEFRLFIEIIKQKIQFLVDQEFLPHKEEVLFAKEFLTELKKVFPRNYWFNSEESIADRIFSSHLKVAKVDLRKILSDAGVLAKIKNRHFNAKNGKKGIQLEKVKYDFARLEPTGNPYYIFHLPGFKTENLRSIENGSEANELLNQLDHCGELDVIFSKLNRFSRE